MKDSGTTSKHENSLYTDQTIRLFVTLLTSKSSHAYVKVNATIKIRDRQFFVHNIFSKQADFLRTTGEILDASLTIFGRHKAGTTMCFL